jgi:excisionase family DNA binding protein
VATSEVMTIDELADYLKVSKSTLYKLAQQGRVPGQKVGKHWRFNKQAIDDWISSSPGELRPNPGDRAKRGGDHEPTR